MIKIQHDKRVKCEKHVKLANRGNTPLKGPQSLLVFFYASAKL